MTCDDGWQLVENKCYKISPSSAKADTLEEKCEIIGGKFLINFRFIVAICFQVCPSMLLLFLLCQLFYIIIYTKLNYMYITMKLSSLLL